MKRSPPILQMFLVALCTAVLTQAGLLFAGFTAPPTSWTAAYELDPTATDPVSQGDDHLRAVKAEVRDRGEAELDWGALGNVTTDTGRLLEGGARCFVANAAPTVNGTITATCLAEADRNGNRGCDEGRCWIDADGVDNVAGNADDRSMNIAIDSDADGDADSWSAITVTGLPASAITSGTLADARVAQSNVTQHQAALSIATSQLTGNMPDARIVESNVTQHAAALGITPLDDTLPFTDLDWTTNDHYRISLSQLQQVALADDDCDYFLLFSDDNGSTFETDAADYGWTVAGLRSDGTVQDTSDSSDSEIQLNGASTVHSEGGGGATLNKGMSGTIELRRDGTDRVVVTWVLGYYSGATGSALATVHGSGVTLFTGTINAVTLRSSCGALLIGDGGQRAKLYGVLD